MSRVNSQDQSYEEYGRAEGEEFYNSVQRLIKHFQTLETKDSPQLAHHRGRTANRTSGTYHTYRDPWNIGIERDSWSKLERSRSVGRLGEKERYGRKSERDYSGEERVGAYIALKDDIENMEAAEHRPAFVRGSRTRRTFSGVPHRSHMETADVFDDNRSDNYRLVSHSQYISSSLPEDIKDRSVTSPRASKRFVRSTPQTASTRSIEKRSRSIPGDGIRQVEPFEISRDSSRASKRQSKDHKKVEYVSSSGDKCFPFKTKKTHKTTKGEGHYTMARGTYSDLEENYASEDSVFDTGYDSSASTGHSRHNQRLYNNPRNRVDIRDNYASGIANYQPVEDANVYSAGQEPEIHVTKEGYKMLELDVNVSGFRPEDIQIVTQGKFLQVIAKGVVVKRGEQGDSRIYRELKRQFTLPEVANAEYLQGILSPEGILQITGPVGVSTNTKKLKRKRVKFHID